MEATYERVSASEDCNVEPKTVEAEGDRVDGELGNQIEAIYVTVPKQQEQQQQQSPLSDALSVSSSLCNIPSVLAVRTAQLLLGCACTLYAWKSLSDCMATAHWLSCSNDLTYDSCRAHCHLDDGADYPTISGLSPAGIEYSYYRSPHAHWNSTNDLFNAQQPFSCDAALRSDCNCGTISKAYLIPLLYSLQLLAVFIYYSYFYSNNKKKKDDALSRRVHCLYRCELNSSASIASVLQPICCLSTLLQFAVLIVLLFTWNFDDRSYLTCSYDGTIIQESILENIIATPILLLCFFEFYSANIVMCLECLRGKHVVVAKSRSKGEHNTFQSRVLAAFIALLRMDLIVSNFLVMLMQLMSLPLCVLLFVSELVHGNSSDATAQETEDRSFQAPLLQQIAVIPPHSNKTNSTVLSSAATETHNSSNCSDNDDNTHRTVADKLRSSVAALLACSNNHHSSSNSSRSSSLRFTVCYSFAKLIGAVTYSLATSRDYDYCARSADALLSPDVCPDGCYATCLTELFHDCSEAALRDDANLFCPSNQFPCAFATNDCLCGNWRAVDLVVIVLHSAHFLLQLLYLLRFDNFDPQQNQIDCVQSYRFLGDNLALFLTNPLISLLSVLEAAILADAWLALQQGISCSTMLLNMNNFYFAAFQTFLEIYKANTNVMLVHYRKSDFGWALFSLVRVDLFVFFAATLFMQCFLFPFSLIGFCVSLFSSTVAKKKQNSQDLQEFGSNSDDNCSSGSSREPMADKQSREQLSLVVA